MDCAVPIAAQEGLSQVDLADVLELQPISLVRLLDRLVEYKLLERRPDPNDRRVNKLFLTAKGRQLVDDLDSLRDAIATDVCRDVPDKALEVTLETLVEMKARIKAIGEISQQNDQSGNNPKDNPKDHPKPRRARARS